MGRRCISPDEAPLVAGAELLGYQFQVSCAELCVKMVSTYMNPFCEGQETQIGIREYPGRPEGIPDLERLRIQLDAQTDVDSHSHAGGQDQVVLKGADTVMLERLAKSQLYTEKTLLHLEVRRIPFYHADWNFNWFYIGLRN